MDRSECIIAQDIPLASLTVLVSEVKQLYDLR